MATQIQTKWIADLAVTTAKLADLNVTTGKIANQAVDKDKLNSDVVGNGLQGAAGTALSVKPDATGGANLAKVVDANSNGVAIKIDDATIKENGSNQLYVPSNGIGPTQIDLTQTYDYTGGTLRVSTPVNDTDVANKSYVDANVEGIDAKQSCRAATTAALADAYTYDNGSSGEGATLTKTSNGAFPAQDGITLTQGQRVLIKNETGGNAPYNGIYVLTTVGDGSNPWVLTRADDNDVQGEFVSAFTWIEEGTALADSGWLCVTDQTVTVGTTDITWTQFSGAATITAGTGLTKSGNTIHIGNGTTGDINGINRAADDISAAVDDSTIEIASNVLQVKNGGITAVKLGSDVHTYYTELITLTGTDITNKYAALSQTPANVNQGQLTVIGGPEQERAVDFVLQIGPDRVDWNALGLDGVLVSGDKLSITYAI
jgi:hypothetical protein